MDNNKYLNKLTEQIEKYSFQRILIFNKILKIDKNLENLKKEDLKEKKSLLETRKIELLKYRFYTKIIKNLENEYQNQSNLKK